MSQPIHPTPSPARRNPRAWRCLPLAAAAAASCLGAGTCLAQGTSAPIASAAPAADLARIVVTASRRDQVVDTTPMAVTAITAETLSATNVRDTQDLTRVAPGLVITSAASEATASTIRLRGVGTSGANLGLEGSVGVFVDGVYLSRPGIALTDLNDIQQVEVLRGPQGTLFGKNTSAGALMLSSTRPGYQWGGSGSVGGGSRDGFRASLAYGGPLVDQKLAFRISAVVTRKDGYLTDAVTGAKTNDRDRSSVKAQLRIDPSPDVGIRLIADHGRKTEQCCAATTIVNGSRTANIAALGGFVNTDPKSYVVANDKPFISDTEETGVSAHLDVALPWAQSKTIVSFRRFRSERSGDGDLTNLDLVNTVGEDTRDRIGTLETTLRGEAGRLDWLVGAYAYRQRTRQSGALVYGAGLARFFQSVFPAQATLLAPLYPVGGGDTARNFSQESDGWSVFTHNIFALTPALKLTLGARQLGESKSGDGRFSFNSTSCTAAGVPAGARQLCPTPDFATRYDDGKTVGTAALSYEPSSRSVVYLSHSKGYKAGGINFDRTAGVGAASATFLPEDVDSTELGWKSSFLEGRARAAVTIFAARTRNFQQNAFTGTAFVISNAARVDSEGVELEGGWRPTGWLTLGGSLVYNKAVYGDETADPVLRGRQVVNAPKWTFQGQVDAERAMGTGGLKGFVNFNVRRLSRMNTSASLLAAAEQEGYALYGARVGLRSADGRWEVSLFGQNLSDTYYRTVVFAGTLQPGTFQAYVGEPRSVGLELRARF